MTAVATLPEPHASVSASTPRSQVRTRSRDGPSTCATSAFAPSRSSGWYLRAGPKRAKSSAATSTPPATNDDDVRNADGEGVRLALERAPCASSEDTARPTATGSGSRSVTRVPSTREGTSPHPVLTIRFSGASPFRTAKRAAQRVPLPQKRPTDPSALR